jgi:hypothetical protein
MKQGNWIECNNGLPGATLVYLYKQEPSLGKDVFSAYYYNSNFGYDSADWATYTINQFPSKLMSSAQIESLPKELVERARDPLYDLKQLNRMSRQ